MKSCCKLLEKMVVRHAYEMNERFGGFSSALYMDGDQVGLTQSYDVASIAKNTENGFGCFVMGTLEVVDGFPGSKGSQAPMV